MVKGMLKHLDLGCGATPRNPFAYNTPSEVFGIDISLPEGANPEYFKAANLTIEPIPFPDNFFDSVSAYDFLEHIPRAIVYDGKTHFPFVELMDEIYRVLKPGGEFYALTPYYPKESSFTDPTHVNFITRSTHQYFTKPHLMASIYGFKGSFSVLRVQEVQALYELNPHWGVFTKVRKTIKVFLKDSKVILDGKQHLVWHLKKD